MTLILSGTDGLSDVDGSAATPAIRGTDANTGIFFPAADTIAFSEGGAEVARFDSSGRLGIGATSPSGKLVVVGGNANTAILDNDNSQYTQLLLQRNSTANTGGDLLIDGTNATMSLRMLAVGAMRFCTSTSVGDGTERMRIDSSGNVGIGTSSPAGKLDITSGTARMYFSNQSATAFFTAVNTANSAYAPMAINGSELILKTGDAERARIDSSGNLLVGQTSAGILGGSIGTSIEASGLNNARITINHSSGGSSNGSYFMQFAYGGVLSGGITQASTATVGFYTGPSDRRLKNNIEDLDSSGEFIDALRPRKWTWIKSGEADSGFVADELQTVISCCVNGEADAVDEDGKPVYQMVDASPPEMIANIVAELKAIRKREKEQQVLITSLTSRITELEAK